MKTKQLCLFAVTSLALAFFVVGCKRPLLPLPQPSTLAVPEGTRFSVEPIEAVPLRPILAGANPTGWSDCRLDQVDGKGFESGPPGIKAGRDFLIAGYAYVKERQALPTNIRLIVRAAGDDRAWHAEIMGRVPRLDLPANFKPGPWFPGAGFEQLISSSGLEPGTYDLELTFDDDGKHLVCDKGVSRQIVIQP